MLVRQRINRNLFRGLVSFFRLAICLPVHRGVDHEIRMMVLTILVFIMPRFGGMIGILNLRRPAIVLFQPADIILRQTHSLIQLVQDRIKPLFKCCWGDDSVLFDQSLTPNADCLFGLFEVGLHAIGIGLQAIDDHALRLFKRFPPLNFPAQFIEIVVLLILLLIHIGGDAIQHQSKPPCRFALLLQKLRVGFSQTLTAF
ncbi:hypothetical protein U14_00718 [Candidatus Moduliflexus flocculans]|uniref:Uncharacterized protein n=1 Tax=Candidatus Moduliflexus flocculans TaxID=1499966 RepID=A0A0S6VQI7_9BACT|nr:hypothetical protein U14_00718 [Candidatus Moduliflexus flocculans]